MRHPLRRLIRAIAIAAMLAATVTACGSWKSAPHTQAEFDAETAVAFSKPVQTNAPQHPDLTFLTDSGFTDADPRQAYSTAVSCFVKLHTIQALLGRRSRVSADFLPIRPCVADGAWLDYVEPDITAYVSSTFNLTGVLDTNPAVVKKLAALHALLAMSTPEPLSPPPNAASLRDSSGPNGDSSGPLDYFDPDRGAFSPFWFSKTEVDDAKENGTPFLTVKFDVTFTIQGYRRQKMTEGEATFTQYTYRMVQQHGTWRLFNWNEGDVTVK